MKSDVSQMIFDFDESPDYGFQNSLIARAEHHLNTDKKCLLAAAPNAGKTFMAMRVIETLLKRKPDAKVLVIPHAQLILKTQWVDRIKNGGFDFTYTEINGCRGLGKIQESVLISLPHSLDRLPSNLEIDLVIVDEAHQWFLANTVQSFVRNRKPKKILTLTGSPSLYVKRNDWPVVGITLQELLEKNIAVDPVIEIVESEYHRKLSDYYLTNLCLKDKAGFSKGETEKILNDLLGLLIEKLSSKHRADPANYRWIKKRLSWKEVSEGLSKTMIVCQNRRQAKDVYQYFSDKGVCSELSISQDQRSSKAADKFIKEPSCKFLIVVNRGILGFDFSDLINILDLSLSLNVDRIFQLVCRLVRRSDLQPEMPKLYLKLTNSEMKLATYQAMSFAVALATPEFYYSYHSNLRKVKVPVKKEFARQLALGDRYVGRTALRLPELLTFSDLGKIQKGGTGAIAFTSFEDVLRKLKNYTGIWTEESALKMAKTCSSRIEFQNKFSGAYAFLKRLDKLDLLENIHPRLTRKGWTLESALGFARQFDSREDFRVDHKGRGAYGFLQINGLLRELDTIFPLKTEKKWNLDTVQTVAISCQTRQEFNTKYRGAHKYLVRTGNLHFLDEWLPLQVRREWDLESAIAIAKSCSTRSEFKQKFVGASKYLEKEFPGKLEELLPSRKSNRGASSWTIESVVEEARKYRTRTQFRRASRGAYRFITEGGHRYILDEVFGSQKLGRPAQPASKSEV